MSYDRAELERVIRAGEPLPDELLDIFKKNAERRRTAKIETRLHKATQHLRELSKVRESSPLRSVLGRSHRDKAGFLPSKSAPAITPPAPIPPPPPLACDSGWTTVGDSAAPFTWGSQETPMLGPTFSDGMNQWSQWSVMTRRDTGEFSLALAVDSDPTSPYFPATDVGLGFKGTTISATIGQMYIVGQGPLVLMAQAQVAVSSLYALLNAARFWPGDAYAVTDGSATLTVSEIAIEWTRGTGNFPSPHPKLLGQSSTEADLFGWGADPYGEVFSNQENFTSNSLDLSATLAHNNDAMIAMIEVDIQLFAAVTKGTPNSHHPAIAFLDYRVDDNDLIVGPESSDGWPYDLWPYPSPFLLTEARLCSFP